MRKQFNKRCAICGKEFTTDSKTRAYCKECYKKKQKDYREQSKGNYIYMFIDETTTSQEVLYIGSTMYINKRISAHTNMTTDASQKLDKLDKQYYIIYADINIEITRDELYFIEYYLIHKHVHMYKKKPIANEVETFNTSIDPIRQIQLIAIAEGLIFKMYDEPNKVLQNKKENTFINIDEDCL